MSEKVKVEVITDKGETKKLEGKTLFIFAIDDAEEMVEGVKRLETHVVASGAKLPTPIFAEVIGRIVGGLVKKTYDKQPMLAAYQISSIADELNEQCEALNKEIRSSVNDEEELDNLVEGFLNQLLH